MKLKVLDYAILHELISNPRQSDRQLAKTLAVTQPTISRRRSEIEKQGLLQYMAMPDLGKLGFEIVAFTFGKWNFQKYSNTQVEVAKDFIKRHPSIVFVSTGRGDFGDRLAVSVHKNYSDYSKFMADVHGEWDELMGDPTTFIVDLKTDNIVRNLTFKCLIDSLNASE